MRKYISTTIATSILLIASGCSTNNSTQPVHQVQACTTGDPHPWCMQMAQTKPLGAAPNGLESTGPANPEMQDDNTPYPRNPALPLITPGIGGIRMNMGGI